MRNSVCVALAIFGIVLASEAGAAPRPLVHRTVADTTSVAVRPEYSRTLRRVLLAVPQRDDAGQGARMGAVDPRFVRAVHDELLTAIPSYSEVGIIIHASDRETILGWDRLFDKRDNIHLHLVRTPKNEVDLWTQDLGEFYTLGGVDRFLVSAVPHEKMAPAHAIARARHRIASSIFGAAKVDVADFVFEAGNLLFDVTEDGPRVLAGEDVVTRTIESARLGRKKLDESDVVELVSRQFGGAEVVVLRGEQFGGLIHIDQAFTLLHDGMVVMSVITDDARAKEALVLRGYAAQLEWLGYRVETLPTSTEAVRSYHASTNALPFTNLLTGEPTVIYPVFPGEVHEGAPSVLAREHLTGKALAAYELFERLGYLPRPVRDVAHVSGGNTHCIANVLE